MEMKKEIRDVFFRRFASYWFNDWHIYKINYVTDDQLLILNLTERGSEDYENATDVKKTIDQKAVDKYIQPLVDEGYLTYIGTEQHQYFKERTVRKYEVTKKLYDRWLEIYKEKEEEEKRKVEAERQRQITAAITEVGGSRGEKKGIGDIPAIYTNPKCYTEDPGIPADSQTEGVRDLILTPFLIMFRWGVPIIVLMWVAWFIHLKQNRKRVRDEWELEYRKYH